MKTQRGSMLVLVGLVLVLSGLAAPVLTPRAVQATTTGCTNFAGGDLFGCQLVGSSTGSAWRVENTDTSSASRGISALTSSTAGIGVNGVANATSGATIGVRGQSNSNSGTAVYAINNATGSQSGGPGAGDAVYAQTAVGNAYALHGINLSSFGTGVGGTGARGVSGWTTTVGGYGVYGSYNTTGVGYAGYFDGDVKVVGTFSKTAGAFQIDNPLDPANQYLWHSFVESPDMMNIYNGNITTDANGNATVTLPDYFEALNQDFRYQLTIIGTFAQAMVASEIKGNQFTIKTDKPNVKVSWQVTGIRHDPYAEQHRIPNVQDKPADERGTYLYPQGYGQPETKQLNYEVSHPTKP